MSDQPIATAEQSSILVQWRTKGTAAGVMVIEASPESGVSAELGPYPHPAAAISAIALRKAYLVEVLTALIGK